MNDPSTAVQHREAGVIELAISALAVAAIIGVELWISQAWRLIGHYLWLDEVLTWLLAGDPSWSHWLSALRGGVDTNPPGLYLQVKAAGVLAGGLTVGVLRWVALIWTGLSVWGVYAVLRRGVGIWAAAAGGFLVAAYPLVADHMLEGRFYMPMLGLAVWCCYFLAGLPRTRWPRFMQLMLGITAVGLCTIHYFGVIALSVAVLGQWWADQRRWKMKLRAYWPVLAGPAALAACIPLLLGQRAGLSVSTWVDPLNVEQGKDYVKDLLAIWPLAIVAAGFLLLRLFGGSMQEQPDQQVRFRPLAGMAALGAMALFIPIFSAIIQPALVSRYAIVSVAAISVAAAAAMQHTRWWMTGLVCVGLATYSTWSLHRLTVKWTGFDSNVDRLAVALREKTDRLPLIFDMRQALYPLCAAYPEFQGRSYFWGATSNPSPYSQNFKQYELDMARRVERFYGWPKVMDQTEFDKLNHGIVVCISADANQVEQALPERKASVLMELQRLSIYRIEGR